ncbi:MAG: tyrosine-type recombinase/integrase [Candidatus Sulfotelmatobacter sp.]
MKCNAWIIRIAKTPEGKWRALKPIWSMRSGKPLLTQTCEYKGQQIDTPGGRWEIEWLEDGKRKRLKCGQHVSDVLKAKARQELRLQAQAAGIAVVDTKAEKGKRLLATAKDEYLAECKANKAPKTHQAMKQVLETLTLVVGRKHLEDITRADCLTKFVTHLRESGLADRTVFHRVACLVTFLKWAKHPVIGLRDAPTYTEQEIRVYSQTDLDALFAESNDDERLLFEFFLYTGCRVGEVQHAEWEDLIQDCKVLLIREKKQWNWKPKGRKERQIRIPDFLAAELQERRGTGLIFPNEETKRPEGQAHHLIIDMEKELADIDTDIDDPAVLIERVIDDINQLALKKILQNALDIGRGKVKPAQCLAMKDPKGLKDSFEYISRGYAKLVNTGDSDSNGLWHENTDAIVETLNEKAKGAVIETLIPAMDDNWMLKLGKTLLIGILLVQASMKCSTLNPIQRVRLWSCIRTQSKSK